MALLKNNLGFHQEAIALLKEVINTYPSINDFPENNNNNNNNIVANKAGAYNIEDAENILIKHIDGCYNNIVGFPLKKFEMSKIKKILDSL